MCKFSPNSEFSSENTERMQETITISRKKNHTPQERDEEEAHTDGDNNDDDCLGA